MRDLMLQRGDIEAQRAHNSGNIWGQAFATVGNTLAGGLQQHAEEQQRKKQSIAFEAAINSGDPRQIISVLGPERGPAVVTALSAHSPDGMKRYTDRMTLGRDQARGILAVPEDMRPQAYSFARNSLLQAGAFRPEELPEDFAQAMPIISQVANYGTDPTKQGEGFTLSPGQQRFGANGQPIASAPPAPADAPKPVVVGRELVDPTTGRVIHRAAPEPASGGAGFTLQPGEVRYGADGKVIANGPDKPTPSRGPTGAERGVLAYYNRANQALNDITDKPEGGKSLEEQMAGLGVVDQQRLSYDGIGSNQAKTTEMQQYRQAQRAFTEARLRKESGAAIPPNEYENDARTYFAQPGDSPETIKQKQAARAVVLDGLGFSAGRAFEEYYGEPFRANSGTRRAAPAPPPPAGGGAPPVHVNSLAEANALPPGTMYVAPDGQTRQR